MFQFPSTCPHVHILLCTHNGAAFLRDQLESFCAQDYANWSLWVSDDGSDDGTMEILRSFQAEQPERQVNIFEGPAQGAARNFLELVCHPDLPDGFVALSDQDDVWFPDHLSRAVAQLREMPGNAPALYASRTVLTDDKLQVRKTSRYMRKSPSFGNALVQNIMAGNTMVMNGRAHTVLRAAGPRVDVPFHDWWAYLLLSGAGAALCFDDEPSVYYRQHGRNTLGANRGVGATLKRLRLVRSRRYRDWLDRNLSALQANKGLLNEENRATAAVFSNHPDGSRIGEGLKMYRAGIRRQSLLHSLYVYAAILKDARRRRPGKNAAGDWAYETD